MFLITKIAEKIARTEFAQKALNEHADLSPFKEKPTPRIILGIFLMGLSYLIGWPAVTLFGGLSIYFREPLIVIIGGPLIYGVSHLVFLVGMYLAGAQYTLIFFRWAMRKALEKILKNYNIIKVYQRTEEKNIKY